MMFWKVIIVGYIWEKINDIKKWEFWEYEVIMMVFLIMFLCYRIYDDILNYVRRYKL